MIWRAVFIRYFFLFKFIRFKLCQESSHLCGRLISGFESLPNDHVFIGGDRFFANSYGYNYLQLTRAYQVPKGALVYMFQENYRNRGGLIAYISANVLTYSDVRLSEHANNRIGLVPLEKDFGYETEEDRRMRSKLCLKIQTVPFEKYALPDRFSASSPSLTPINVNNLNQNTQYLQLRSATNDNYYILLNNRANSESAFLNSFEVLLTQSGTIKIGVRCWKHELRKLTRPDFFSFHFSFFQVHEDQGMRRVFDIVEEVFHAIGSSTIDALLGLARSER